MENQGKTPENTAQKEKPKEPHIQLFSSRKYINICYWS